MLKEKIKKVGIIVLCVTLFLSAMSLTLSLFPKDKTTSPSPPKPIYSKSFNFYEDFDSYDFTGDRLYLVKDDSLTDAIALEYNSTGSDAGVSFSFRFNQDEIPESGSKLVMEFDYTIDERIGFSEVGMMLKDDPYGFGVYGNEMPAGSHSVVIVYDGLNPNLYDEEGVYSEYDFTVYVDNSEVLHCNEALTGTPLGVNDIQGFGLFYFEDGSNISDGEIVFTLHTLSLKVY